MFLNAMCVLNIERDRLTAFVQDNLGKPAPER